MSREFVGMCRHFAGVGFVEIVGRARVFFMRCFSVFGKVCGCIISKNNYWRSGTGDKQITSRGTHERCSEKYGKIINAFVGDCWVMFIVILWT